MAVSFVATGADFVSNASTTFNTTGPGQDGDFRLAGGTKPFPDEYVIEFFALGEDSNGELGQGSGFTGIKVYASADDFNNGVVLFDYQPQNSGQTGTVQGDGSGVGDCYISFNSVFPAPPGAPALSGRLFVAPGTDAANQIGSFETRRFEDIDFNGDGDFGDPNEAGNGKFAPEKGVICFTPGTMIVTNQGLRAVETLREGDLVFTRDNGMQPVAWVGSTTLSPRALQRQPSLAPVRIAAGSLGSGLPQRDVVVSPNHRMLIAHARAALHFGESEVLVAAKHLVGQPGVTRASPLAGLTYAHVLCERHQILMADGLWSESFQPGAPTVRSLESEMRQELVSLFPELRAHGGGQAFPAARRTLKAYEARVLADGE
ncbi:MAG: Hint domain-containing protein [Pseudomonadota bacterium]